MIIHQWLRFSLNVSIQGGGCTFDVLSCSCICSKYFVSFSPTEQVGKQLGMAAVLLSSGIVIFIAMVWSLDSTVVFLPALRSVDGDAGPAEHVVSME